MAAGFGEGEGSGRGGNPLWMIIWLLLLFFIGEIVKQLGKTIRQFYIS